VKTAKPAHKMFC